MLQNATVLVIPAFNQQFDPVFRFGAFLQSDLKLGYKSAFPWANCASRIFAPTDVPERRNWLTNAPSHFASLNTLHALITSSAKALDFCINGLSFIKPIPIICCFCFFTIHSYLLLPTKKRQSRRSVNSEK